MPVAVLSVKVSRRSAVGGAVKNHTYQRRMSIQLCDVLGPGSQSVRHSSVYVKQNERRAIIAGNEWTAARAVSAHDECTEPQIAPLEEVLSRTAHEDTGGGEVVVVKTEVCSHTSQIGTYSSNDLPFPCRKRARCLELSFPQR